MRFGYGLIAGSLVLAGAVGAAWSQAPKRIDPNQVTTVAPPAPAAVSDLRVKPTGGDIRVSTPIAGFQALSADDCTDLGGQVWDDKKGLCKSGKICYRTDNFGKTHAVCLDAKAE